jgi:hypothetical protein
MDLIDIQLDGGHDAYRPGEMVSGTVAWELEKHASGVEVRLFWYTRGKGTTDVQVVKAKHFDAPGTSGSRSFKFVLPEEPYSFSGKLISLVWALEAVVQPGDRSQRREIVVGPAGREIVLGAAAATAERGR